MALVRVRRLAQLTLPAEVRRALNVHDGDYLEAEIVENGVLLKPVAVVERNRAWQRIERAVKRVRRRKPLHPDDYRTEEEAIASDVKAMRNQHG